MNKLEMAHEYAMKHIQEGWDINYDVLVVDAWQYADAMQAEADKRGTVQHTRSGHTITTYERPAVLQDEWQPDWSVAPAGAAYWIKLSSDVYIWMDATLIKISEAPSFGYQGSWKNSLRKRP